MNATMKNIGTIDIPSNIFSNIQRIHRSIPNYWEDKTDYAANKAYNNHVVNGNVLPEDYGEMVHMTIDANTSNIMLGDAYKRSCWIWNGKEFQFQYPSAKEVYARYLCMM